MNSHLASVSATRIGRPTSNLSRIVEFYVTAVGFDRLGGFEGHNGYDGCFVGLAGAPWHLEFIQNGAHLPSPTDDDLLVLYMPAENIAGITAHMRSLGHEPVEHVNPYWTFAKAVVFMDPDGYPLVFHPEG